MGCDIHMYVEYKRKNSKGNDWVGFGERLNPGRNYWMFGILAGVRSDGNNIFPPKGIPKDMDTSALWDFYEMISDLDTDDTVSLETAEKYASYGRKIIKHNGKPFMVEHPDWHTPSWLSLEEYEECIRVYNTHAESYKHTEPEYEAVLAAMKKLSEFNNEVRIVFWFDN